jgi:predicted ferric reductase
MFSRTRELWYALAAIVATTALYAVAYWQAGTFPGAYTLVGHGIGILGFILMLMTQVLYSMRKQRTDARWGSMSRWLRFHIFTGLVGPYMVLLHTSMRFRGLAGIAMLLTVVVVASGVIGRYLYTRLPRETGSSDASPERLAAQRSVMATWHTVHVPLTWALFVTALVHSVAAVYYATLLQ